MKSGISIRSSLCAPGRIRLFAAALLAVFAAWHAPFAQGQCPTFFYPAGNLAVGTHPYGLATGDFNGDGKLDLAVVNSDSGGVSILLGMGSGLFGPAANVTVGVRPYSLVVGDFNNDGKLDLAVANVDSSNISIRLGTGTGSFVAAANVSTGSSPRGIVAGDFNGDGKLDLATANYRLGTAGGSVFVALGTGTGTFDASAYILLGNQTFSLAAADLNTDGKLDLAVADVANHNVYILLGTGTGSFEAATTYLTGSQPLSIAAADFNNDGKPDLATVNVTSRDVSILLGTGSGEFGAATSYLLGGTPYFVMVRDLNGDGQLDLVVPNSTNNNISILQGTGTASFGTPTNYLVGTSPYSVAAGDFSGDGKLDLAVSNDGSNSVGILVAFPTSTPPAITTHPAPQSVLAGVSVSFSITATSPTASTFQWRRNGVNLSDGGAISGATTSTLTINSAELSDNGSAFACVVTNSCGSTTSNPAGLAVLDNCPVDFNHDGSIDFFDYLDFVDAYSIGC